MTDEDLRLLFIITAALCTAIGTIAGAVITPILKDFFDTRFQLFKLKSEHEYEQRKEIKKILSRNKIQLLNASEELNHRLWNFFGENYNKKWHCINSIDVNEHYYFLSFIYRVVAIFSGIRKIEKEMIYLDTTFSAEEDLDFIKYLRLIPQIMYDTELFRGFSYDRSTASDHFFRGQLEGIAECLISVKGICDFTTFCEHYEEYRDKVAPIHYYLNGLNPEESRLRWDRLQVLHIVIMTFINSYGYDFQKTSPEKIISITSIPRKSRLLQNFAEMVRRMKLDNQKELKPILRTIVE